MARLIARRERIDRMVAALETQFKTQFNTAAQASAAAKQTQQE